MKNSRTHNIRLGCEIALSVISVVLAILFITFVAQIYYGGGEVMYSRAIVWGKLKYMIAPVAIWLVAVIGCFVLSVLFPNEKRPAAPPTASERVVRLRKRIPSRRDVADGKYINAEHKQYATLEMWRYIAYGIASAFAVGVAIYTIVYLCQKSNFSSGKINTDILYLVKNVFPWIVASFVLFIGVVIYEFVVAKPQLGRMTKLLVASKGMSISRSPLVAYMDRAKSALIKSEDKIVLGTRIVVALVAVVFIGIGAWDGGAGDVLGKAVAICTECIGLG
ncbi:MAG: hypothetical protein K2M48_00525 [Clostridiales bacterium]|nr:hypothetical protein [Clostridiales bacterium]